ncbi:sodium:solute symporter family protein [Halobacillus shinanisalinarum]|uniref:Sodium:solute symporter family protein n=1 Tax=Halobacillus shinanisalinarum TaxID=2932258 RepID=A0ABY4H3X6_9BACI|nr:sodium:solute symporter family protein [Halobacillus shinanisalinarum]UOQ95123.1 sodium:solute symporter family protein [Halobacillus shinanisalinarum]
MIWYIVWLVTFLVGITILGMVYSRKIKTADDFMMANFSLGFFPICGSIIATALGAAAVIGKSGKGFEVGLSWIVATIPFVTFSILLAIVLGPTIRKLKLYTLPDFFVRRFGKSTGIIPALVIAILYMTPTFGMQIVAMGSILTGIIDISVILAMLLGFVVCVAFTLMGGMPSVAWTDAIQSVLILLGIIVLFVVGLNYVGGVDVVINNTPDHLLSFYGAMSITEMVNYFIIFGPFYLVWQTTWQRLAAAKTERTAVRAVSTGYVMCGLVAVFSLGVGIIARQVLPLDTDPDLIYTEFLTIILHPAIGGFIMVSVFAAVLTGATSFLLSGAANISKDIYHGWIAPNASDKKVLNVSRFSVAAMAFLGLGVALFIKDIIVIYTYAVSLSAITMVMPVMAAMFWKRATKKGVIVSIIGSLVFTLIWILAGRPFDLHEVIPGLVVSLLLLVGVSLFTKHSPEEEVIAYFYGLKGIKDPALNSPESETNTNVKDA